MILYEEKEPYIEFVTVKALNGATRIEKIVKNRVKSVTYEIEVGDTLSSISAFFLGNGSKEYYLKIYNYNYRELEKASIERGLNSCNEDTIYPGTEIEIFEIWRDPNAPMG